MKLTLYLLQPINISSLQNITTAHYCPKSIFFKQRFIQFRLIGHLVWLNCTAYVSVCLLLFMHMVTTGWLWGINKQFPNWRNNLISVELHIQSYSPFPGQFRYKLLWNTSLAWELPCIFSSRNMSPKSAKNINNITWISLKCNVGLKLNAKGINTI